MLLVITICTLKYIRKERMTHVIFFFVKLLDIVLCKSWIRIFGILNSTTYDILAASQMSLTPFCDKRHACCVVIAADLISDVWRVVGYQ